MDVQRSFANEAGVKSAGEANDGRDVAGASTGTGSGEAADRGTSRDPGKGAEEGAAKTTGKAKGRIAGRGLGKDVGKKAGIAAGKDRGYAVSDKIAGTGAGRGTGTLYLVATPIGNLEDITYRAVRILKEADVIAAEDTRQTRKLLTHYGIGGTLVSYHEHNKKTSGPSLVARLLEGQSVALVSDAGLPGISDPGEDLVRLAIDAGIAVVPVPGPSASLSALIVSGLPSTPFRFAGFLPRERNKLAKELERLRQAEETIILYESPHRLAATLAAMREALGNRRIALARELTKKHEEILRGTLEEALDHLAETPPRGEYVLVVEGRPEGEEEPGGNADTQAWWSPLDPEAHVRHYEDKLGLSRKEAMKRAARDRGVSRRDIYQALLKE